MDITRRSFFRSGACAALGAAAAASTVSDLFRVAAAAPLASDYRALVCVFLYGGSDGNNVVVPWSQTDYDAYAAARPNIAIPRASLLPITPARSDGRQWALHPSLAGVQSLFAQGRAAVVANTGPLVAPITRTDWLNGKSLPPQLFSHSDQTVHWQTSLPDRPPATGWGGRAADTVRRLNTASLSMAFSIAGSNTFQVGSFVAPYQVSDDGSQGLEIFDPGLSDARSRAMNAILHLDRGHLLENGFRDVVKRAVDNDALLRQALGTQSPLATVFPDTYLGRQLRMVARLISARSALGFTREVFFVADGGYDTHGDQVGPHAALLTDLNDALAAFYAATVELGVASGVTAFTASDFGRTYPSNGQGTDHGWGNHHFVIGGSVRGGDIYGRMPVLAVDGPDDTDTGRWIPSTSVDQYAGTLANWFGVSATDMATVLPNLGRFATKDLGFLS